MLDYKSIADSAASLSEQANKSDAQMQLEIATLEMLYGSLSELIQIHPYLQSTKIGQAIASASHKANEVIGK
jgi:hypothetical protein